MTKFRRNDPCPCGSGKKYKKCCLSSGIFEQAIAPQVQEEEQFEFDAMPCTVPLSAIPATITADELVASKFLRNLSIKRETVMTQKERAQLIDEVEAIFQSFNKIQLLGALGLHLIYVIAVRNDILIDEEIEIVLEYAMSFAFASSENESKSPTEKVVKNLYDKLLQLKRSFTDNEYLSSLDSESTRDLLNHTGFINVRGDGYPKFVEEVFNEYFSQHEAFISSHYAGATLSDIQELLQHVERRILVRLTDPSGRGIIGAHMLWEQWKQWSDENEVLDPEIGMSVEVFSYQNPIMGGFLDANKELPRTKDGFSLFYRFNDYEESEAIFSLIPRNEKERALLDAFSCQLGDNHEFMEGEFRGTIMNYTTNVRQKPFLKHNGKYYCFSILLPYRRMFEIASGLFNVDMHYRENHFLGNAYPECRDNYTERKVFQLLSNKFSDIRFYQSVHYVGEAGEMDILGTSPNATYLIEVKAYQLTDSYRGGTVGIERKLQESVGRGAEQTIRSQRYILDNDEPMFTSRGESNIQVVKNAPVFRICVTLEHYGALTCNMKGLVTMGVIESGKRDIWITSLYDLMTIIENIKDEKTLTQYLSLHNQLTMDERVHYVDELDVFGAYLTDPAILQERPSYIKHYSSVLDEKYNGTQV